MILSISPRTAGAAPGPARPRAAIAASVAASAQFRNSKFEFRGCLGLRMRISIDLAQPCGVEVRVLLSRRERRMAEQLLNRPQVGPRLQKVRGEGVPQRVR